MCALKTDIRYRSANADRSEPNHPIAGQNENQLLAYNRLSGYTAEGTAETEVPVAPLQVSLITLLPGWGLGVSLNSGTHFVFPSCRGG